MVEVKEMLLDIPNNEKIYVSNIIEFVRKQKNVKIENLVDGICAKQTYYKMRKDILIESEIYDGLLSKLGLFYNYKESSLPSYDKLWEYFLLQKWEDFNYELNIVNLKLNEADVNNYILSFSIDMILNNNWNFVGDVLELLPETFREILSFFYLKYLYTETLENYIDVSKISMRTLNNKFEYLLLLIREEKYYEATTLCASLLNVTNGKLHYSVLVAKLFIIQAIEPISFDDCCEEIKNDPCYIPDSESAYEFMYTAGMFYYLREIYDKAWFYLENSCKSKKNRIPGLLFLYHMETITEYSLKERYLNMISEETMEKSFKVLFEYYEMKYHNVNLEKLENFLWNECRGIIEISYPREVVKKIIRDELFWIARQTGDKRKYYQFNKKQ